MAEGMITPDQLRRIADEKDMEKAREALEKKRKVEDEQHQLRDAFMTREIHPDVFERVSKVVRAAAILVDDGLATGVTARAALLALRRMNPRRLVLAIPVCASQTAKLLRSETDDLICLLAPTDLEAVGLWYRNFEQTSDEEVIRLLEQAHRSTEQ